MYIINCKCKGHIHIFFLVLKGVLIYFAERGSVVLSFIDDNESRIF